MSPLHVIFHFTLSNGLGGMPDFQSDLCSIFFNATLLSCSMISVNYLACIAIGLIAKIIEAKCIEK